MPPSFDPTLLDSLPADLWRAVEAQIEALAAERAARLHLDAENADLRSSVADLRKRNADLAALNARPEHLGKELKRARFGPRSEKLNADQVELSFQGIETAIAQAQEKHDTAAAARSQARPVRKARGPDPAERTPARGAGDRAGEPDLIAIGTPSVRETMAMRLRGHGPDRRGSLGTPGYDPGAVPRVRHGAPALRLPEGPGRAGPASCRASHRAPSVRERWRAPRRR